jgi:hypothetical protein
MKSIAWPQKEKSYPTLDKMLKWWRGEEFFNDLKLERGLKLKLSSASSAAALPCLCLGLRWDEGNCASLNRKPMNLTQVEYDRCALTLAAYNLK